MLPYRHSHITQVVLILFFLILIAYAYYEARGLLFGPNISITSNSPTTVNSQYVLITGTASYIASLSVDGEQIPVTESGGFSEPFLLAPGENYIMFDAKDTWGRIKEDVIKIFYQPLPSTSTPATVATSSNATSSAPAQ